MKEPPNRTLQSRFGFQDPDLTTPEHDRIVLWLQENAQTAVDWLVKHSPLFDPWPSHQKNLAEVAEDLRQRLAEARNYHDKHWSFQNTQDRPLYNWEQQRKDEALEHLNKLETALANTEKELKPLRNPLMPTKETVAQQRAEHPVLSGSYTIGFVDLFIHTNRDETQSIICRSATEPPVAQLRMIQRIRHYYLEVKPRIPSFGELTRQLRLYQTYTEHASRIHGAEAIHVIATPDLRFRQALEKEGFAVLPVSEKGLLEP